MKLVRLVFSEVTVAPYGKVLVKEKYNIVRYITGAQGGGLNGGDWLIEPVNESDFFNDDQGYTLTIPTHQQKSNVIITGIEMIGKKAEATGFDETRDL